MSTATLKINSYQSSMAVLIDDKIVFSRSALENYRKDSPVLSKAGNVLYDIYRECNSEFSLTVYGNAFEQALMGLYAKESGKCFKVDGHSIDIPLTAAERLQMLSELGMAVDVTIPLSIESDIPGISLPLYPGITFTPGTDANKITISEDIGFIRSELFYSEEIGFCVGGVSEKANNKVIVGCTAENVRELVAAYIETKYVNPLIGKLFAQATAQLADLAVLGKCCLINRISPYFFVEEIDRNLSLFTGDKLPLQIRSVSLDEGRNVAFDDPSTLKKVVAKCESLDANLPHIISISADTQLSVIANAPGPACVALYYDDAQPFATVNVVVKEHTYADKFIINIKADMLNQKEKLVVGQSYFFYVVASPLNADDAQDYIISIDHPEVAEIDGKYLKIKNFGSFTITVKGRRRASSKKFTVYKPVEQIIITDWPKDGKVSGNKHCSVKAEVYPKDATEQEICCAVDAGKSDVRVIQRDPSSGDFIVTGSHGRATLHFYSQSDPAVCCEKKITFRNLENRERLFAQLARPAFIVGAVLLLFRSQLAQYAVAVALLFLIIAAIRREERAKTFLVLGVLLACLMGFLRVNVFYDNDTLSSLGSVPTQTLEQLRSESEEEIREGSFFEREDFISSEGTTYYPKKVEYLGYVFVFEPRLLSNNNHLYFIFRVEASSDETSSTKTFFACDEYEKFRIGRGSSFAYNREEFSVYADLDYLLSKIGEATESSLPEDSAYDDFG